jgi:hypothetical protein
MSRSYSLLTLAKEKIERETFQPDIADIFLARLFLFFFSLTVPYTRLRPLFLYFNILPCFFLITRLPLHPLFSCYKSALYCLLCIELKKTLSSFCLSAFNLWLSYYSVYLFVFLCVCQSVFAECLLISIFLSFCLSSVYLFFSRLACLSVT